MDAVTVVVAEVGRSPALPGYCRVMVWTPTLGHVIGSRSDVVKGGRKLPRERI